MTLNMNIWTRNLTNLSSWHPSYFISLFLPVASGFFSLFFFSRLNLFVSLAASQRSCGSDGCPTYLSDLSYHSRGEKMPPFALLDVDSSAFQYAVVHWRICISCSMWPALFSLRLEQQRRSMTVADGAAAVNIRQQVQKMTFQKPLKFGLFVAGREKWSCEATGNQNCCSPHNANRAISLTG